MRKEEKRRTLGGEKERKRENVEEERIREKHVYGYFKDYRLLV